LPNTLTICEPHFWRLMDCAGFKWPCCPDNSVFWIFSKIAIQTHTQHYTYTSVIIEK